MFAPNCQLLRSPYLSLPSFHSFRLMRVIGFCALKPTLKFSITIIIRIVSYLYAYNHSEIGMRVFFSIALCLCAATQVFADATARDADALGTIEFVSTPYIKTVRLHRADAELSEPTLELNSGGQLLLSFDDIAEDFSLYSYSIVHCDYNWEPSNLFLHDYMDGFEVNEIRDYTYSTATTVPYMHSRLLLPNNDVRFRISGNYLIRVFNRYQPDVTLIQRRFVVYEPLVNISAQVRQPPAGEHRLTGQRLEVSLNTQTIRVNNHLNEIRLVVCQNYLFQGCLQDVKPIHVHENVLDYTHPDALIFEGMNEFRLFDVMSIRRASQGVLGIEYFGGYFNVQLTPDASRWRQSYSYYADLNGRFVVRLENSDLSHIEADYVWVYFTLNAPLELDIGKSVYLFGELTGWQLSPANRMEYSHERNAYELRLLLKQGAYSYRYVVVDDATGKVDVTHLEGSHFDTENNYMILVYYQPMGSRFQRVVGYRRVNTRNPL